jgi:alanyl-tRNA synthetase
VGEESVAAGTRRITAVTGPAAHLRVRQTELALAETAAALRVPPAEVPVRVAALVKEARELKKQLSAGGRAGGISVDDLFADAATAAGTKVIVAEVPGGTADGLRQLIDQIRNRAGSTAVLLAGRSEDKVVLVAGISRDLEAKGLNAGEWVRTAAKVVNGSGGGRADMAQAGGKDPTKLAAALESARESIQKQLGAT